MNKYKIAYAAGLFDGEGCIYTKWPARWQLCVEIKMVSKPAVEAFAEVVGGNCLQGYERSHARLKQWQCRIYDNKAIKALQILLPYLIEKKEQAELGLRFKLTKTNEERSRINYQIKSLKRTQYD